MMTNTVWDGDELVPLDSLLDEETLDEEASTQVGAMFESRRRDAD
jgi:hypothetical protein